jgi:hypothetical protein
MATDSDITDATGDKAEVAATIHEAERATFDQAVARRESGADIVVRGENEDANRKLARQIEATVGPTGRPEPPHTNTAGPHALPHFHQTSRSPEGHSFYETNKRKARKRR